MEYKWYDYETESGNKLIFPRNHFKNIAKARFVLEFPFKIEELNDAKPSDAYLYQKNPILVIGGDAHCHDGKELGKDEEGIVFYCQEKDKEEIIKQIKRIA